jgi:hypothetical protein
MRLLIILCLDASLIFAQTKLSASQQAGDCAVNITGNGNSASLVCNSIDPKLAEQVKAILNGTRRNEKAIEGISKQLSAIQEDLDRPTLQIQQHSEGANSPNTVNINQRPPARRIPPERRSEIVALLARTPAKIEISVVNNAEAFQFGQDWYDVFKQAGWTIENDTVSTFLGGLAERGISMTSHGETVPAGSRFAVPKASPAGAILISIASLGMSEMVHGQMYPTIADNKVSFLILEQPDN